MNQSAFWAGFMGRWAFVRSAPIMPVSRALRLTVIAVVLASRSGRAATTGRPRLLLSALLHRRRILGRRILRRRRILGRRRGLLRLLGLLLHGLQVVDDLLQGSDAALQRLDLP